MLDFPKRVKWTDGISDHEMVEKKGPVIRTGPLSVEFGIRPLGGSCLGAAFVLLLRDRLTLHLVIATTDVPSVA